MKKNIILANTVPSTTIGLDLSDRTFQFCELNSLGEVVEQGQRKLDRDRLGQFLAGRPAGARVETGGHSAWVRELVERMGHEAVVANARELEAVTGRSHRTDQHDARPLARLARVDAALLNPIELRGSAEQVDLFVIRARAVLVEARTMLINFARGITKTLGHRLPASASHRFVERVREAVPEVLEPALVGLLEVLQEITAQIEDYDAKIEGLAVERYPQTRWLKQAPGVGTPTALTFVLTVGEPGRFHIAATWVRSWV